MKKRTALVTGGNRGIGLAMANKFAKEGDRVVILDLSAEPSEEASRVTEESGGAYFACDVAKQADAERAVREALETFGFVDVLLNNAGISRWRSFLDTTEEDIDAIFNVNVKGIYNVTRPIAGSMMAAKKGVILNTASMGGKWGQPLESAYCASKAAVIELTKIMAMEFGPYNVRANSLCPGIIKTNMSHDAPHADDFWLEKTPLGRLGRPDDVADVAYFLSTHEARYMTGQAVNVTGGMIMY
ncbi:SDR family oxidoreductase [Paenibacillus antri]|uniref:SDR family oxidoreductase n=1 Tax=Paenibacillus antri TaxID=2582848 RepID=A0A5R9GH47_9BACL|nr:SDR family oxidoreductase [Paenibacillus antri]TLS52083.1 SDR family oxidoreductase [Paenibacillus antri]